MNWTAQAPAELLWMLMAAAPFVLLGLLIAGLMHVLLPESLVLRWLGHRGLSGVLWGAAVGVPLPICSCGVVPVTVELTRKGARRPAAMSFLISTPESSIDSILLSWGLLGPVMAIARPLAAFFSATLGGVLAMAYPERRRRAVVEAQACGCHHEHGHAHKHGHPAHSHSLGASGTAALDALAAFGRWCWPKGSPPKSADAAPEAATAVASSPSPWPGLWSRVVRPALRYGFVELLDDLAFWLVLGLVVAALLASALPADLASLGLGGGLGTMLLMLVAGVPLYMCASASTPVAAALLAKGLSPGAALVLLLSGPGTNVATLLLLGRSFGRRFVKLYLTAIVVGALASGLLLDAVLAGAIVGPRIALGAEWAYDGWDWFFFTLLVALLLWRLGSGALARGWAELAAGWAAMVPPSLAAWPASRWRALLASAAVLAYLAGGFHSVPAGSRGYGFVLGALSPQDHGPGLHWLPPWPVGRLEIRHVDYPRRTDVGYRTDLALLARRRELSLLADPDEWHSPVAAMNTDAERASYVTADENLLELSFTVQYGLLEPRSFFYALEHSVDLVGLYAEATARRVLAGLSFEAVLSRPRGELEAALAADLAERLEPLGLGLRVEAVRIVDLHPPAEVVAAFRDLSSAREDRETRVFRALESGAALIPKARGEAAALELLAAARAAARSLEAAGRAEAFEALAGVVAVEPRAGRDALWRDRTERLLAGREKVIVPPGRAPSSAQRAVTLWLAAPPKAASQRNGG